MRIGFEDLDRESAQLFAAQTSSIARKAVHTEQEQRALGSLRADGRARMDAWRRQYSRTLARSMGWTFAVVGGVALLTVTILISGNYAWAWLPGTVGGLAGGAASIRYSRRAARANRQSADQGDILHEQLAAWLPAVDLPRLERTYFDAVLVLSNERSALSDGDARDILAQLNILLGRYRELAVRRRLLLTLLGEGEPGRTEQERVVLEERAATVTDPIARRALEDSVRMCEERIANLGKLKPALDRLEAQQESIVQTVASVQSTLARWQAAPGMADIPDLGQIQQSVVRINDETYAVEHAVQEVMALNT